MGKNAQRRRAARDARRYAQQSIALPRAMMLSFRAEAQRAAVTIDQYEAGVYIPNRAARRGNPTGRGGHR